MDTEPQEAEHLPFITIRPEVMRQLKISANEYMVLDTVYHLSRKHGYCYKSLGYMAADLSLPKMTVKNIIDRLMQRGLLGRSAAGLTISNTYADAAYISTKTVQPRTKMVRKRTKMVPAVPKPYDRTKTAPKKYNKKDIEKNVTIVTGDAPQYGKPDINDAFAYWETAIGYAISGRITANRRAASNLIKKHGLDTVKRLIDGVALAQGTPYAPRIADFCGLQADVSKLLAWGKQQGNTHAVAQF